MSGSHQLAGNRKHLSDVFSLASETGTATIDQVDGPRWKSVSFESSYNNPVATTGAVSHNGGQPCHARLRNLSGSGFEFRVEEWEYLDERHAPETVNYMIVEKGTYETAGGTRIEAGTVSTDETFADVGFTQEFTAPPVVLTQAQTYNGADPIVTRQRDVSAAGTQVRVQEEEARGRHLAETIGYIVIEPGTGSNDGTSFEAGRTRNTMTDTPQTIGFSQDMGSTPVFLAGMQTFDGPDSSGLRYRNLDGSGVDVFVEEERSADDETNHTDEVVGYFVIANESLIYAE